MMLSARFSIRVDCDDRWLGVMQGVIMVHGQGLRVLFVFCVFQENDASASLSLPQNNCFSDSSDAR